MTGAEQRRRACVGEEWNDGEHGWMAVWRRPGATHQGSPIVPVRLCLWEHGPGGELEQRGCATPWARRDVTRNERIGCTRWFATKNIPGAARCVRECECPGVGPNRLSEYMHGCGF